MLTLAVSLRAANKRPSRGLLSDVLSAFLSF